MFVDVYFMAQDIIYPGEFLMGAWEKKVYFAIVEWLPSIFNVHFSIYE